MKPQYFLQSMSDKVLKPFHNFLYSIIGIIWFDFERFQYVDGVRVTCAFVHQIQFHHIFLAQTDTLAKFCIRILYFREAIESI